MRQKKQLGDRINTLMNIKGSQTVESFHKRLGKIMWDKCGMARNAARFARSDCRNTTIEKRILE